MVLSLLPTSRMFARQLLRSTPLSRPLALTLPSRALLPFTRTKTTAALGSGKGGRAEKDAAAKAKLAAVKAKEKERARAAKEKERVKLAAVKAKAKAKEKEKAERDKLRLKEKKVERKGTSSDPRRGEGGWGAGGVCGWRARGHVRRALTIELWGHSTAVKSKEVSAKKPTRSSIHPPKAPQNAWQIYATNYAKVRRPGRARSADRSRLAAREARPSDSSRARTRRYAFLFGSGGLT